MQEIYQAANPRDCGIYGAPPDFAARFFTGSCGPKPLGWSSQRALRVGPPRVRATPRTDVMGLPETRSTFFCRRAAATILRIAAEWNPHSSHTTRTAEAGQPRDLSISRHLESAQWIVHTLRRHGPRILRALESARTIPINLLRTEGGASRTSATVGGGAPLAIQRLRA